MKVESKKYPKKNRERSREGGTDPQGSKQCICIFFQVIIFCKFCLFQRKNLEVLSKKTLEKNSGSREKILGNKNNFLEGRL